MKGNYAALQRLTPAVANTQQLAQKSADIYKGIKAKEQLKVVAAQKKNEEYLKDLIDYESDFNEADVDGYFKDEMMRVGSEIRDELYDNHVKKTQMEHYGNPNSKEYRDLITKDQQLRGVPDMFQSAFDQYEKSLAEYESGKGTTYDTQLNGNLEKSLMKTMNGGWKYNTKKKTFDVTNPDTGETKSLSQAQFASTPLLFERPKLMVDIPKITKDMAAEIGVETRSYFDEESNSQVTIKKSEASGEQRRLVREHILDQIDNRENLVEKLRMNGINKFDYADDVMTAAGFRSGTTVSSQKKSDPKGTGSKDRWEYFKPETVTSKGYANDGAGNKFEVENEAFNSVSFKGTGDVSLNPSSIYVMNTSSPLYVSKSESGEFTGAFAEKGKKITVSGTDAEIIQARTVSKTSSGVQNFKLQKVQQMKMYQGDQKYRVRYSNSDGKEVAIVISKGKEVPNKVLRGDYGDYSLETLGGEYETSWGFDTGVLKGDAVPESSRAEMTDLISSNSKMVNMAIGEGTLAGKELLVGIPIDEGNSGAVNDINATTKIGAFKNTTGFINEWVDRYGSATIGNQPKDAVVANDKTVPGEEVATEEIVDYNELVGLDADAIMDLVEVDEATAKRLAGKDIDEINAIIEELKKQ